jgi:hypothetical protein
MRELDDATARGEQVRDRARAVADSFHDPTLSPLAIRVTARFGVESWLQEKDRWVGRSSNALRHVFQGPEISQAFETAAVTRTRASLDHDPNQLLHDATSSIDQGLAVLQEIKQRLERESKQGDEQDVSATKTENGEHQARPGGRGTRRQQPHDASARAKNVMVITVAIMTRRRRYSRSCVLWDSRPSTGTQQYRARARARRTTSTR